MLTEHSMPYPQKEKCADPNCDVESSDLVHCEVCDRGFCPACADTEFNKCEDCGIKGCEGCVVYSKEFDARLCGGCIYDRRLEQATKKAKSGSIFALRNYLRLRRNVL